MNRTEYNSRVRSEVEVLKHQYRNDNSAFLIWFLKNIFCLSEQESVDSVVDGPRDKGIDGIWVDENDEEIYIFQSEFSPNDDRDSGDSKIREFSGVATWFSSETEVNRLQVALINLELKERLNNLKISDKVARGYGISYVFVTNKIFDVNATEYLGTTNIDAYDNNIIFGKYTYMVEADIANTPKTLELSNSTAPRYRTFATCGLHKKTKPQANPQGFHFLSQLITYSFLIPKNQPIIKAIQKNNTIRSYFSGKNLFGKFV